MGEVADKTIAAAEGWATVVKAQRTAAEDAADQRERQHRINEAATLAADANRKDM